MFAIYSSSIFIKVNSVVSIVFFCQLAKIATVDGQHCVFWKILIRVYKSIIDNKKYGSSKLQKFVYYHKNSVQRVWKLFLLRPTINILQHCVIINFLQHTFTEPKTGFMLTTKIKNAFI